MTTINKQVSASTDDCHEAEDTTIYLTNTTTIAGRTSLPFDAGLRWQTVNIPQAASITTATLSGYLNVDTNTMSANIRGIDEDNTATWSAGSRPSQRTKTTATITANEANWGNWGVDNWVTIDITSVIQEIIDRGSWVANNALAIVIENTGVDNFHYMALRSWDYAGNAHGAKLAVVYSTTSIPVMFHQLQQQGIA